jgi:Fic family protein
MKVDEHSARFKLHVKAAQYVYKNASTGTWPKVTFVHSQIMAKDSDPGVFRARGMYLAADAEDSRKSWCPSAEHVASLMNVWEHSCVLVRNNPLYFGDRLENACLNQYYHFLVIHPFSDGNGRTGRLMYNALRLLVGLPWHTFTTDMHEVYVGRLRVFEAEFKATNPDVYNPNLV